MCTAIATLVAANAPLALAGEGGPGGRHRSHAGESQGIGSAHAVRSVRLTEHDYALVDSRPGRVAGEDRFGVELSRGGEDQRIGKP